MLERAQERRASPRRQLFISDVAPSQVNDGLGEYCWDTRISWETRKDGRALCSPEKRRPGGGEVPAFQGPGVRATLALCKAALFLKSLQAFDTILPFFSDDQFIAL